jgi:hypothetical protein
MPQNVNKFILGSNLSFVSSHLVEHCNCATARAGLVSFGKETFEHCNYAAKSHLVRKVSNTATGLNKSLARNRAVSFGKETFEHCDVAQNVKVMQRSHSVRKFSNTATPVEQLVGLIW